MLKIFHGIRNIGNMPWLVSRAQRQSGFPADCYSISRRHAYQTDISLNLKSPAGFPSSLLSLLAAPFKYDIFQFYFDLSLLPYSFDLPFLKMLGKKSFFWFCGCDVRNPQVVFKKYRHSGCRECLSRRCSPFRSSVIRMARRYADKIFYTTPDLAEFLPSNAIWLPVPIDLAGWTYQEASSRDKNKIRIAHAPTNQSIKGTKYLRKAVAELNKKGYNLELVLIESMPYNQVREMAVTVDIAVDQLLIGAYGLFSAEMMALGKPVICYIRDDLKEKYPAGLPVVSANPETIAPVLEKLINNRPEWAKLGRQGRDYVEKIHDVRKICQQLLKYYQTSKY